MDRHGIPAHCERSFKRPAWRWRRVPLKCFPGQRSRELAAHLLRVPFVGFRWVIDAGAHLSAGRILNPDTLEPLHTKPAEGVALFVAARREDWAVRWELEKYNGSGQHAPRSQVGAAGDLDTARRMRDSTEPVDAELTRAQYTGEDFARVTAALEAHGLQSPGQRHNVVRMLGFSWAARGLVKTPTDAGELAAAWLQSKHNGASETYNRSPAAALEDTRRAAAWGAASFLNGKGSPAAPVKRPSNRSQTRQRHEVTDAERRYLCRLVRGRSPVSARKCWRPRQLWRATVAMVSLLEHVGADGRRRLPLARAELLELPGWSSGSRGTYSANVALASALGILRLEREAVISPIPAARRPRKWRVVWTFRGRRSYQPRSESHVPHIKKPIQPHVFRLSGKQEASYGRPELLTTSRAPP